MGGAAGSDAAAYHLPVHSRGGDTGVSSRDALIDTGLVVTEAEVLTMRTPPTHSFLGDEGSSERMGDWRGASGDCGSWREYDSSASVVVGIASAADAIAAFAVGTTGCSTRQSCDDKLDMSLRGLSARGAP